MVFTKRKTEIWNYPILSEHHDKITNVNEFVSNFGKITLDRSISIYIHIPYCKTFCYFCPYYKELNGSPNVEALFESMKREIRYYSKLIWFSGVKVGSIQIGGGTPSCIPLGYIESLLDTIRNEFDMSACELISMEANVTDLSYEYLSHARTIGINRISFGIQTFNPGIRKKIGIKATVDDIYAAVENLKKTKIPDYSADLIYNLPDQTIQDIENDFRITNDLDVTYIELNYLNIYPNTLFEKLINKNDYFKSLPSDENNYAMFSRLISLSRSHGYNRVLGNKISKKRNDLPSTIKSYFDGYTLGIGPSSKTSLLNMNYRNCASIDEYIKTVNDNNVSISIGKFCDEDELDIRKMAIKINTFAINKNEINSIEKFRDVLNDLIANGYITETSDYLYLTEKGSLWLGNISYSFLNKYDNSKMTQMYLDALRYNENPYNQNKTGVVKKKS